MSSDVREGEVGRAIRFIHGGSTELPIRDIEGQNKKEPHIEYGLDHGLNDGRIVGAENYCYCCYQSAIQYLIDNEEDYLFLVSYPKHRGSSLDENHIVGYIKNERYDWRAEERVAVFGETKIFPFEDGLPMSEFGYKPSKGPLGKYGRTFDSEQTSAILAHFESCDDVTEECLRKVLELEGRADDAGRRDSGC